MNCENDRCAVTGKRQYLSEREALETAAHQIETNHAPGNLKAYECQWCHSWHLTKSGAPAGKAEKPRGKTPRR
jgi:hypothetical protein